jgi:hypothetical protein
MAINTGLDSCGFKLDFSDDLDVSMLLNDNKLALFYCPVTSTVQVAYNMFVDSKSDF